MGSATSSLKEIDSDVRLGRAAEGVLDGGAGGPSVHHPTGALGSPPRLQVQPFSPAVASRGSSSHRDVTPANEPTAAGGPGVWALLARAVHDPALSPDTSADVNDDDDGGASPTRLGYRPSPPPRAVERDSTPPAFAARFGAASRGRCSFPPLSAPPSSPAAAVDDDPSSSPPDALSEDRRAALFARIFGSKAPSSSLSGDADGDVFTATTAAATLSAALPPIPKPPPPPASSTGPAALGPGILQIIGAAAAAASVATANVAGLESASALSPDAAARRAAGRDAALARMEGHRGGGRGAAGGGAVAVDLIPAPPPAAATTKMRETRRECAPGGAAVRCLAALDAAHAGLAGAVARRWGRAGGARAGPCCTPASMHPMDVTSIAPPLWDTGPGPIPPPGLIRVADAAGEGVALTASLLALRWLREVAWCALHAGVRAGRRHLARRTEAIVDSGREGGPRGRPSLHPSTPSLLYVHPSVHPTIPPSTPFHSSTPPGPSTTPPLPASLPPLPPRAAAALAAFFDPPLAVLTAEADAAPPGSAHDHPLIPVAASLAAGTAPGLAVVLLPGLAVESMMAALAAEQRRPSPEGEQPSLAGQRCGRAPPSGTLPHSPASAATPPLRVVALVGPPPPSSSEARESFARACRGPGGAVAVVTLPDTAAFAASAGGRRPRLCLDLGERAPGATWAWARGAPRLHLVCTRPDASALDAAAAATGCRAEEGDRERWSSGLEVLAGACRNTAAAPTSVALSPVAPAAAPRSALRRRPATVVFVSSERPPPVVALARALARLGPPPDGRESGFLEFECAGPAITVLRRPLLPGEALGLSVSAVLLWLSASALVRADAAGALAPAALADDVPAGFESAGDASVVAAARAHPVAILLRGAALRWNTAILLIDTAPSEESGVGGGVPADDIGRLGALARSSAASAGLALHPRLVDSSVDAARNAAPSAQPSLLAVSGPAVEAAGHVAAGTAGRGVPGSVAVVDAVAEICAGAALAARRCPLTAPDGTRVRIDSSSASPGELERRLGALPSVNPLLARAVAGHGWGGLVAAARLGGLTAVREGILPRAAPPAGAKAIAAWAVAAADAGGGVDGGAEVAAAPAGSVVAPPAAAPPPPAVPRPGPAVDWRRVERALGIDGGGAGRGAAPPAAAPSSSTVGPLTAPPPGPVGQGVAPGASPVTPAATLFGPGTPARRARTVGLSGAVAGAAVRPWIPSEGGGLGFDSGGGGGGGGGSLDGPSPRPLLSRRPVGPAPGAPRRPRGPLQGGGRDARAEDDWPTPGTAPPHG